MEVLSGRVKREVNNGCMPAVYTWLLFPAEDKITM